MRTMQIIKQIKEKISQPLMSIWVGGFLDIFGFSILGPFLPRILLDMGASLPQIGLLLSANAFVGFFSGFFWGALSDKFGRRPILLICRFGTIVGYLVLAFSTNISMVLIARIIDGFFSRNIIITLTIVGDIVPPHNRSREMSKAGVAWIIGGLIGPAIGALISSFGIFGLGLFCASMSIVAILITLFAIRESNPRVLGQAVRIPETAVKRAPVISFALLKEFLPRILLGQSLFINIAHFIFATTISLFITKRFGFSIAQIGEILTLIGILNLSARLLVFPLLLRRFGDKQTLIVGILLYVAAFTWLSLLTNIWEYVAVSVFVSFATTCSVDVMNGIMSRSVAKEKMGEMIGLNSSVESVSLILSPMIGSYLIALPVAGLYGLASILASLVALLLGLIAKRKGLASASVDE